jgi:Tfp pilus assembly protein PilV
LCAPKPPKTYRYGFSLFELVLAIGIISFALISIIGLMSVSMNVHQDSSNDMIFSIMTETALQEVRNYSTPSNSLYSGATSPYNFSNKFSNYTGYIYFATDGQITADSSWNLSNASTSVPNVTQSTTAANQSTEVGINLGGSSLVANQGRSGMPLAAALTTPPSSTVYQCQISTIPLKLTNATTATPSMYLIKLNFVWPASAPAANQHSRQVITSISNTVN